MARLIEGYAEGLSEKVEFEPRIKRMKQRGTVLEDQLQQLADEAVQQRELQFLIGPLEEFVTKVQRNLAVAEWEMKREIIGALVRRVEIDKPAVTVVFRVGPDLSGQRPEQQSSQHCWRRDIAYKGSSRSAWEQKKKFLFPLQKNASRKPLPLRESRVLSHGNCVRRQV
jgi:site-specific DNA recombinase